MGVSFFGMLDVRFSGGYFRRGFGGVWMAMELRMEMEDESGVEG